MNVSASSILSGISTLIIRPAAELSAEIVANQSHERMETNGDDYSDHSDYSEYVRAMWNRFCNAGPGEMMTSMQAAFCNEIEERETDTEGLPIFTAVAVVAGVGFVGAKLVSALRNYLSSQNQQ